MKDHFDQSNLYSEAEFFLLHLTQIATGEEKKCHNQMLLLFLFTHTLDRNKFGGTNRRTHSLFDHHTFIYTRFGQLECHLLFCSSLSVAFFRRLISCCQVLKLQHKSLASFVFWSWTISHNIENAVGFQVVTTTIATVCCCFLHIHITHPHEKLTQVIIPGSKIT